MTTEIFQGFPGRSIAPYDLLEEMAGLYDLDRREAHESVLSFLSDLGPEAILKREPTDPRLLESNPHDLDVTHWLTVTDEAARQIRDAFAAVYANA